MITKTLVLTSLHIWQNCEKPKPTSARALEREAQEIGLFGCNHENALMTPRGRYLASCSHSWKINRSFNHVTTIILGVSGAGKSSTINHMLRFKIADTNSEESETRETSEFRAIEPERNLAVSDLSLVKWFKLNCNNIHLHL